jgi:DNA repair ATPase RecN
MSLSQINGIITTMQTDYSKEVGARNLLLKDLADTETDLAQAKDDIANWDLEQVLFTEASDFARIQTLGHIEQVVTAGLQTVFTDEEHLGFKVNMRKLGDVPAADWRITDKAGEHDIENDPEDADGGGVSDVVSLALRAALLELFRAEGPVFFDESGKHVSAEYSKNLAYFVKTYAEKTGRQVINITHNRALAEVADKAYQVIKRDGISEAVEQ